MTEIWQRKLHCVGSLWSEACEGNMYEVAGTKYVVQADGTVFTRGADGEFGRVLDEGILGALQVQIDEDVATSQARQAHAEELAQGDALLAQVLRMHMKYTRGCVDEPSVHDGVAFYDVGRNASHTFALGVKDGKLFRRSDGEGPEDADGNPTLDEHVSEIGSIDGCCLGHF